MHAGIKTRRTGPGLSGEDWWKAFELEWPRPTYRIVAHPEGQWEALWRALPERHVRIGQPTPPAPWAWARHEASVDDSVYGPLSALSSPPAGETVSVFTLSWPAGGLFVPAEPSTPLRPYRPLPVAGEILLDAQGVTLDDPEALLRFVNRWGRLGVGIPGDEAFAADGVLRTGECLRELVGWIATLHALQHKQPTPATWPAVAALFRDKLGGVQFGAQPTRQGLIPLFPLRRLLDALYLELWGWATGAKRLRQCRRCAHFFIRGREDQIFCTGRCARLWHVKRWKKKKRQEQQRQRRIREAS
jgi:hypothetical protein